MSSMYGIYDSVIVRRRRILEPLSNETRLSAEMAITRGADLLTRGVGELDELYRLTAVNSGADLGDGNVAALAIMHDNLAGVREAVEELAADIKLMVER